MDSNLEDSSFTDESSSSSISSAFSECNSDRSGEFPPSSSSSSSSHSRRLLIASVSCGSEDLINHLISDLESSSSVDDQKQAAMEIRLLAKHKHENRRKLAKYGAVRPLVNLISSTSDRQLQEYCVTAILNLSLCDENREIIITSGAVKQLVKVLKVGNSTGKENAACALLRLSDGDDDNKALIGRSGAIPYLAKLLETGSLRGKKDACTALYALCSIKENKVRAIRAGVVKVLLELMADFASGMVDKSAYVLSELMPVREARKVVVEEGGVAVVVEILEVGTQRQREVAVAILLQFCEGEGEMENVTYRSMVAREGAIPPLVALAHCGSRRAKQKAETLIELLRQTRPGSANAIARASPLSVT